MRTCHWPTEGWINTHTRARTHTQRKARWKGKGAETARLGAMREHQAQFTVSAPYTTLIITMMHTCLRTTDVWTCKGLSNDGPRAVRATRPSTFLQRIRFRLDHFCGVDSAVWPLHQHDTNKQFGNYWLRLPPVDPHKGAHEPLRTHTPNACNFYWV